MTIAECRELAAWAEDLPIPVRRPAPSDVIGRHLAFMDATLPTQRVDHETGKSRLAVYVSILRELTEPALAYMAREACKRCRWFPTPAECFAIAGEYREPPSERAETLRLCADRSSEIAERWIADPNLAADVPDQWKRIAVERGTLRRMEGGTLVERAKYHGPFKPIAVA